MPEPIAQTIQRLWPGRSPDDPISEADIATLEAERARLRDAEAQEARLNAEQERIRADTDPLYERRQQAEAIRREAGERASLVEDARTLLAHDHPGLGDVSDLTDDEAIALAFPGASGPTDDDLANDLAANVEASKRPAPKWTGEDHRPNTKTHEPEGAS